jgi:predicted nucleic-acid-binding Zn-ribbon protein
MNKSCVACGGKELEPGFIPDAGDNMSNVIMGWHEGAP